MSDTIYDWARRELDAIAFGDKPLNAAHRSALARVAAGMADDAVQNLLPMFADDSDVRVTLPAPPATAEGW